MTAHYRSVEGREIEMHVFGDGPRTGLVMAGVHGDEPSGVDVARLLLSRLNRASEEVLRGARIVVMPLVNPDGHAVGTRTNARGVDINRNFPDKTFGTGEKSGQYYGGELPASEPETQAILEVVSEFNPRLIISLHAALACVNYNGPCVRAARRISRITGLPATGDIGYPCPGSMGSYYGAERRRPVITLELPRGDFSADAYVDAILDVLLNARAMGSRDHLDSCAVR